jgi:MoaA/NifB/PqqE/SkfB family radical SAM enzyme
MEFTDILKLGFNHLNNSLAENFRIHSSLEFTKPVAFYGIVNERCNVKCRQCEYWRLAHYREEMSIAEWQEALINIKNFVGSYSINFSGGEPFIKKIS